MRKPNFNENVGSDLFVRRGFQSGLSYEPNKKVGELPPHKIGGVGNFEILRSGQQTQYLGNRFIDLDQARSAGRMFSGTTTGRFYEVDIPDPQDVTWIAEYARLEAQMLAAGNTPLEVKIYLKNNPPFGRPQRTIKVKRNMGSDQISTEAKLTEMIQEVKNGNVQSAADQAILTAELARIYANANNLNALTIGEIHKSIYLMQSIGFKGLGTSAFNPLNFGIMYRIIDREYYSMHKGVINMFIQARALGSSNPIISTGFRNIVYNHTYGVDQKTMEANPVLLTTLEKYMTSSKNNGPGKNFVIDLLHNDSCALLDEFQLMYEINLGGITVPDVSIDVSTATSQTFYPMYCNYVLDEMKKGFTFPPINFYIGSVGAVSSSLPALGVPGAPAAPLPIGPPGSLGVPIPPVVTTPAIGGPPAASGGPPIPVPPATGPGFMGRITGAVGSLGTAIGSYFPSRSSMAGAPFSGSIKRPTVIPGPIGGPAARPIAITGPAPVRARRGSTPTPTAATIAAAAAAAKSARKAGLPPAPGPAPTIPIPPALPPAPPATGPGPAPGRTPPPAPSKSKKAKGKK